MGEYNMYISTSGIFTEKLYGANTTGYVHDTTLYLEKGTYYIRCEAAIGDRNIKMKDNVQGYFGIYQEKMKRSGTTEASTMKNAMTVNSGKYGTFVNYGVCNKYVEQQWLKVEIKTKSDFIFDVEYTKPQGYLNTKVFIHDKSGQAVRFGYNKTGLSIEGAEPGIYYIEADGYGAPCQMKITTSVKDVYPPEEPKVTAYKSGTKTVSVYCVDQSKNKSKSTVVKVKNIKLAAPKVTTYKKGTKVVKGTAKKGLTVYVKYNGKTYKAKAASNGKYSVKTAKLLSKKPVLVYVKDAYNNSSSTVKVTVK